MPSAPSSVSEPARVNAASVSYAESYLGEDDVLRAARERGIEFGAQPIGAGGGAALRTLAAAVAARSVIEVGSGAGVSGLYLLDGMPSDGQLVSIDVDATHQAAAKDAFVARGIDPGRYRFITAKAAEVLPRMREDGYDLVLIDADKGSYETYYAEAVRMLRPGGLLCMDNMLWHDKVADPSVQDADTTLIRDLGRTIHDDDRLVPALLSVGDGLLVAAKR